MNKNTTACVEAISRLETHKDNLLKGNLPVRPGMPVDFTNASIGDCVPQGDLYILRLPDNTKIPADYVRNDERTKLVPGDDAGSHHYIQKTKGMELYWPPEYNKDLESTRGPIVRLKGAGTDVVHMGPSKHGTVNLGEGCYEIGFQRLYDAELRAERRARD